MAAIWLMFMLLLLGGLFIAGLVVVLVAGAISVTLFDVQPRWAWLKVGIPAYVVVFVGSLILFWSHSTSPEQVFETEFGFKPPPTVVFHDGDAGVIADSGSAHLHFEVSRAVLQQIVGGHYKLSEPPQTPDPNAPGWWTPPTGPGVEYYTSEAEQHGFASERREIYYEPATGHTWYGFLGID